MASRSADERFYGGPRFGRSGNGIAPTIINDMDSRGAERFFIGSRYGKRSELERKFFFLNHSNKRSFFFKFMFVFFG